MRKFLERLDIAVPRCAVSYSTEGADKITFLIGKTGQFISLALTNDQVIEMKKVRCFGSFGWDLNHEADEFKGGKLNATNNLQQQS